MGITLALAVLSLVALPSADQLPSVAITAPANYTYFYVPAAEPHAYVSVEFQVANLSDPVITNGVIFMLDQVFDPEFPGQALTVPPDPFTTPVLLPPIPAGQHTITACLGVFEPKPGGGSWWNYMRDRLSPQCA